MIDDTYMYDLFVTMEYEIQRFFNFRGKYGNREGTKKEVVNAIHQNGDLQFQWYLLASEIEDNVATIVLGVVCFHPRLCLFIWLY